MTNAEHMKLGVVLVELWPDKFKQEDFEVWFRDLDRYPLAEVIRALHTWKNRKPFPPKTVEIVAVLKAHDVDPLPENRGTASPRRTDLATDIAKTNPRLAHLSDAELIVLNYRQSYFGYVNRRLAPAKLLSGEIKRAELDGIDAQRVSITNQCKCALVNLGMSLEHAEHFSPCPVLDRSEFEQLFSELKTHAAGMCQAAQ